MNDTILLPVGNKSTTVDPTFKTFKTVTDIYIVGILCTLGITGNIITILVLGKDRTIRRTTGFLLQALALADCIYLITCLFYQTLIAVNNYTTWIPHMKNHWPYIEPFVWPCASIAQTAAVWLVVVVTADRYIAICRPLHAPQYSTMSRIRKAVLIVWVLSILYNLPRFFERTIVYIQDPATNFTIPTVNQSSFRKNKIYIATYKTCAFFIVRFLLPLSLLAFFNTRLIQAIKESYKLQERTRECCKKERYTLTLVVVVIVFAICETPDFALRLYISLREYVLSLPYNLVTLRYINVISNLCLTINSFVNFVIYCFLGQRFRRILFRMLCVNKRTVNGHLNYRTTVLHSTDRMEEMTVLVRTS